MGGLQGQGLTGGMKGGREGRGTKGYREGPLGAVEQHSRGAALHPLPPQPEGHDVGGWGRRRG